MLTYSFENIDTESMYEHLYRCIKQDILQKKLRAGEKLPSKRTFAKNLGVSTITVESAYAQLVAEGFLYTLPKRGYYVCELEREEPVAPLPPRPKGCPHQSAGNHPAIGGNQHNRGFSSGSCTGRKQRYRETDGTGPFTCGDRPDLEIQPPSLAASEESDHSRPEHLMNHHASIRNLRCIRRQYLADWIVFVFLNTL